MKLDLLKGVTMDLDAEYREESAKLPLVIAVLAVLLVAAPFIATILRINDEGAQAAVVTKYNGLIEIVTSDLGAADSMLHEQDRVNAGRQGGVVKLIVPEVVLIDEKSLNPDADDPLNIELDAIYWSPANPIVGINGETYHVGEKVQGYEIIEIGKTSVRFKSKQGNIVVKDFYENLLYSTR
jgi:hypothetical protein